MRGQGDLARCGKHDGALSGVWRHEFGSIYFAAGHGRCTEAASGPSNAAVKKSRARRRAGRGGSPRRRGSRNVEPGARGAGVARLVNVPIGPVVGYLASESATATKTDTPILTTPQSISVVTKDQMQAQGAQNVTEALRYTPGVTVQSFGANAFFDSFKLRGFDAPRYLDGLRLPADATTFAIPRIETYGLERLEVLKGPSSGLYGQSDPGGLLNMVSKRPTSTPQYEIVGIVRIVRALSGRVRHRRSDRQERRVSLSHRRPWARQQQPDRLRPGQQAVHCTELHLASDDRHDLHDSLAVSEGR